MTTNKIRTESNVDDLRILQYHTLLPPQTLLEEIPVSQEMSEFVEDNRKSISNIIRGLDDRLLVIIGPCSIHDPVSAKAYVSRLKEMVDKYKKELFIIMRVYFEKPRTTTGWKGLINDPHLDESFDINIGLRISRKLIYDINEIGVPVGSELLDTNTPQYIADLMSWGAIGARTTECQLHREMASGLSMPVGFKNGTSGDTQIAVDACRCAASPHWFLGLSKEGIPAICQSAGNPYCHVILRGGTHAPNYDSFSVQKVEQQFEKSSLQTKIIIDCSHANSLKDHKRQLIVLGDVCQQVASGSRSICGVMIESHLKEGAQSLPDGLEVLKQINAAKQSPDANAQLTAVIEKLEFGKSITDKCVGWEESVTMLELLADAVTAKRSRK